MICVEVKASRDYEIRIESGSLKKAGEYIGQVVAGRHAVIVTDSTVKELYLDTVEESLSRASFQTDSFVIPSGEKSKDAAHYIQLLEFLAEKTVTSKRCPGGFGRWSSRRSDRICRSDFSEGCPFCTDSDNVVGGGGLLRGRKDSDRPASGKKSGRVLLPAIFGSV